jgi:hypothetical protein
MVHTPSFFSILTLRILKDLMGIGYIKSCPPLLLSPRSRGYVSPREASQQADSRLLLPALAWPFCYKALRF